MLLFQSNKFSCVLLVSGSGNTKKNVVNCCVGLEQVANATGNWVTVLRTSGTYFFFGVHFVWDACFSLAEVNGSSRKQICQQTLPSPPNSLSYDVLLGVWRWRTTPPWALRLPREQEIYVKVITCCFVFTAPLQHQISRHRVRILLGREVFCDVEGQSVLFFEPYVLETNWTYLSSHVIPTLPRQVLETDILYQTNVSFITAFLFY